jgi:hypothetical protein
MGLCNHGTHDRKILMPRFMYLCNRATSSFEKLRVFLTNLIECSYLCGTVACMCVLNVWQQNIIWRTRSARNVINAFDLKSKLLPSLYSPLPKRPPCACLSRDTFMHDLSNETEHCWPGQVCSHREGNALHVTYTKPYVHLSVGNHVL